MRYRFLTECFPFHPKLSIIGMQKLFIQSNSCLLSQVWHSKTLHSQWRNWKLFVYIEGNKCQNNIVNMHSRLCMHAMGVMHAQPSTHTLLQSEQFSQFSQMTGNTCVTNNAGFALLCRQQLVLLNVFIRRRQTD